MMRSLLTAVLLFNCQPPGHTLLEPTADGGADAASPAADAGPGTVWTVCADALEGGGLTGDPCDFPTACGMHDVVGPSGARCVGGELLISTALYGAIVETECVSRLDTTRTNVELLEPTRPGCVAGHTCWDGFIDQEFELCQIGVRASVRADAPAPYTDCASMIGSARDGDRCTGELHCAGTREREDLVGWCEDGLVRLSPLTPLTML